MTIWPGYVRLLLCQTNSASDEAGHDRASGWNARGLITIAAANIPPNLVQVMMSAGEICFESVKLSQVHAVPHPSPACVDAMPPWAELLSYMVYMYGAKHRGRGTG